MPLGAIHKSKRIFVFLASTKSPSTKKKLPPPAAAAPAPPQSQCPEDRAIQIHHTQPSVLHPLSAPN